MITSVRFLALAGLGALCLSTGCYTQPRWRYHPIATRRPGIHAPSRASALGIPAPPDEAWMVVYNDLAGSYVLRDRQGNTFGYVEHGSAIVLRLPPGDSTVVGAPASDRCDGGGCEGVGLRAELRPTCMYFARLVERTVGGTPDRWERRAELAPEARNNAAEWLTHQPVAAPRWATPTASPSPAPRLRESSAPDWWKDDAVCAKP